ncbi:MAG: hypothetical protein L0332_29945 [Chloroflexi bacterium]|nr:hypothetical protein [Chloroflexota bacterium]MCI0580390.1 hypothetical protein [Chloroflexota bacterium]MCI0648641.1 hypothetical protein [Chloroflexota bacterium]MCI0730924.1 hypothetical protein [Chloroflexota bacterium]
MTDQKPVTKSVRLNQQESELLAQISEQEGVSEAAILKRFVREGLVQYRLEEAVAVYEQGEADLQAAARYAGISVYQMMAELQKRDIAPPAAAEKFIEGLRTLVETFGGSEALRQTIAEYEQQQS